MELGAAHLPSQSEAIRSNQKQSEAIGSNQKVELGAAHLPVAVGVPAVEVWGELRGGLRGGSGEGGEEARGRVERWRGGSGEMGGWRGG